MGVRSTNTSFQTGVIPKGAVKITEGLYREGLLTDSDVANIGARDILVAAQNPAFSVSQFSNTKVAGYKGANPFHWVAKKIAVNTVYHTPKDTGVLRASVRGKFKGRLNQIDFYSLAGAHGVIADNMKTAFMATYKAPVRINSSHYSMAKKFSITSKPTYNLGISKIERNWKTVGKYSKVQNDKHHFIEKGMKDSQNQILEAYRVGYEMALNRLISLKKKAGMI